MSYNKCADCGLMDHAPKGNKQCFALKRTLRTEDFNRDWECHYYIATIIEDDEPLTPFEHFLLKLDEIEKKKVSVLSMATA